MLAIGAGGLEVAMAIAGEPFYVEMPLVWGIRLTGRLPDWVSAKDVILEMLRRHKTDGGKGRIIEYYGPGLTCLSAMDRHVIANMGAELGATTSVFPSDDEIRHFLKRQKREQDWIELKADPDASMTFKTRSICPSSSRSLRCPQIRTMSCRCVRLRALKSIRPISAHRPILVTEISRSSLKWCAGDPCIRACPWTSIQHRDKF